MGSRFNNYSWYWILLKEEKMKLKSEHWVFILLFIIGFYGIYTCKTNPTTFCNNPLFNLILAPAKTTYAITGTSGISGTYSAFILGLVGGVVEGIVGFTLMIFSKRYIGDKK